MKDFEIIPERAGPDPWAEKSDQLATKLAAVWIWTVFFGLNTGLSASYLGALGGMIGNPVLFELMGRRPGMAQLGGTTSGEVLMLALPVIQMGGILANLGSWAFLYLYFSVFLLPAVLLRDPRGDDDRRRRIAAAALRRTYLLILVSGVARVLPEGLIYLLPLLGRLG